MSDALSTVWIDDVKPEMGSICWRDNIFFVDDTASASGVSCDSKLIAYHHDDKVQALVDALVQIRNARSKMIWGEDSEISAALTKCERIADTALAQFNPTRKESL